MAIKVLDISLRAVNFVFLVIILGLTGSLINGQNHSNPRVNYALFTSVFGLVTSSFYGVLAQFIEFLAWPLILFIIDLLNVIFTIAAAAALATGTRVHSCTNTTYLNKNAIAEGSSDRCRKAQASTAFLFFSFVVFVISFGVQLVSLTTGGVFGTRRSSAPKAGVPTMSTV